MSTALTVNGRAARVDIDPSTPLLWALRDELQLVGSKFGCGAAQCGACTVHVNGVATRSCVTPIAGLAGAKVLTIEAMADDRVGKVVEAAWVAEDVAQCGYCQSGQIMAAVALLKKQRRPTDAQIDAAMSGILCRCGSYVRVRAAIHAAAKALS